MTINNLSWGTGVPIVFPATQDASTDVNTLDDYEEGTWTMGLSFGHGTTGITYAANTGTYTKIGNLVSCVGYLSLNSKGSSTGPARITGLPFTVGASEAHYATGSVDVANVTFADQMSCYVNINSTEILLNERTNLGVTTDIDNTDFAINSYIIMGITYIV